MATADAGNRSDMADQQGGGAFDKLVSLLDYPMFIVTTAADQHRAGCLVGFASQTSINPARFLVGLSRNNHTFTVAQTADHLAVHVLAHENLSLAELFGGTTGDNIDKFGQCTWHRGPAGMPILDAAPAWFVGRILRRFDLGDHVGHLLEPIAANAPDELGELTTFADVRNMTPGHQA